MCLNVCLSRSNAGLFHLMENFTLCVGIFSLVTRPLVTQQTQTIIKNSNPFRRPYMKLDTLFIRLKKEVVNSDLPTTPAVV